ncbi:MAG: TrkH family potassium uptake protein [Alicyclobacillus macrosporangiidus]|uniref:TrkH family potassium uptake protein n=1 Tax=Alicyclobacillus macrosporangiidus TaxID=392015 RepID=UPI0026F1EF6D|nr:potassium transporter TrkG [Alicyclobacillus macrosporangiidus]MCL6598320.1 TrkH family potassium uptake protein [Alicyclobacillus macrosporangiidus]
MSGKSEGVYVLKFIGVMHMFVAGVIFLPFFLLLFYPEELNYAICFLLPAGLAWVVGFLLSKIYVPGDYRLSIGYDAIIVVGIWILATLFSAFPFMLAGMLYFTQAYFEAMSGWTTTRLSVIDVPNAPKLFLFFRSVIQFFGGVGIVLIVVSVLSESSGMRLYTSEWHNDKLLPNLAKSARMTLKIYSGYFLAGTLLYVTFGMPIFDAINHSMTSLSTGGFSTEFLSIGKYDSIAIELITVILMLLGAINFYAHFLIIWREFRAFFRLGETKLILFIIGVVVPIVAVMSLLTVYRSLSSALRISFFNVVSALTTTGFATVNYDNWPESALLVMIMLMIIGGGIGSTAGGIKLGRINLLVKQIGWSVRRKFMPERMVNKPVTYRPNGKTVISSELYSDSANYALTYLAILFVGTLILVGSGYSLQDSLFEFSSALGTVGLSVGLTTINTPPLVLWTMTFGMLFGRIEIFVIFSAIIKIMFKIKRIFKII